ncbi:MAG: flagellar biogenesis protein FliO [Candidatus Marinamargulisbacteria bacterium]|jgi:flagellar biogenesis protein FliO
MSASYYIQLILSLLALGAFLFGVLKMTTTFKNKKYSGDMKVVDRLPVDNGVALLIVKIRDKDYLMSVGGKEAKLIEKLS